MTEIAHARKLGELLVDLGVFTEEQIQETVQIAMQIGLPLGRALILSNKLREEQLRIVLQLQSLLKDNVLDLPQARKVLDLVRFEGTSLSNALKKTGVTLDKTDEKHQKSKLANLIQDAGLVTEEDVEEAVKVGYETGTPVGKMLVVSGRINHAVLARALEIQVMLREGKMSHGEAVELLKAESLRVLPVDQSAEQRGLSQQEPNKRVRLGELFMLSGVLTEGDMLNVLEMGLTNPKPLGDILIDMGLVSHAVLDMALSLQDMISKGILDIRSAAGALQEMASTGKAVDPTKHDYHEDDDTVRLGDLLKLTGLVDNEDIQQAIELSSKYPAMIGKMLVVAGAIDEGTLLAALRSQFLMRNKAIGVEDSVQALLYAQRHRISLDDALEELGVRLPVPLRRDKHPD